jgi:hypothetical protein
MQIDKKRCRFTTPEKVDILLEGHTLLQPSWFEEKWGLKPPQLDQFKPCIRQQSEADSH